MINLAEDGLLTDWFARPIFEVRFQNPVGDLGFVHLVASIASPILARYTRRAAYSKRRLFVLLMS